MNKNQKEVILKKSKKFFQEVIIPNHIKNLKKLTALKEFKYNPFLYGYLANFLEGNDEPTSLAKILIYPRILGTSITTSFGSNMQKFCNNVLSSLGSAVSGIDIEFIDHIDERKKYCQVKVGPETINKDDVDTIHKHFQNAKRLAQQNSLDIRYGDLIVGILYGLPSQLSGNYRNVAKEHPVYIGKDFWHRLTGDENFYSELIETFGDAAKEINSKKLIEEIINELSKEIQKEKSAGQL